VRRDERDLVLSDVERRVGLREFIGFEDLTEETLAAVASLGRRRQLAPGALLSRAGEPRAAIPLLLAGDLHAVRGGRSWPYLREPRVLDLFWLARDREPLELVTDGGADLLELPFEAAEDLLQEHFPIWLATVRQLAAALAAKASRPAELGELRADRRDQTLSARIAAIAEALPFARGHVDALLQLEEEAEPVRLAAGDPLWQPGEAADALVVLLDGGLRGPVDETALGVRDLFACRPRAAELRASRPTVALKIGKENLLDVLEDHHALARDLMAMLAAAVVRAFEGEAAR
jgi:CRP-like cAMP-binding protein